MAINASGMKGYSKPWTELQLRHLLQRTLFGFANADFDFFKGKSMEECVDILLTPRSLPPPPVVPIDKDPVLPKGQVFISHPDLNLESENMRHEFLKAWWMGLMLDPQRSITEKMLLFWHKHFAIQFKKITDTRYDYLYLTILRRNAIGNFKTLTKEITITPGMLAFLNGNSNEKAGPNENYARELQELYTIGTGSDSHYTEGDVKAAAKVLSGWKDDKRKVTSYFDPSLHDIGDKVFSPFYDNRKIAGRAGTEGAGETDELIEMICANRETSKFLCRKLYRYFVDRNIDEHIETAVITPLAEIMVQSGYDMKPVLKALFTSEIFYAPVLMGSMFKSHVDFMVGIFRGLKFKFSDDLTAHFYETATIKALAESMGQEIGDPPEVAGWPAYYEFPGFDQNWVSSDSLAARKNAVTWITVPGAAEIEDNVPPLILNLLDFINQLTDPGNSKALIHDLLHLFCFIQPNNNEIIRLEGILDSGQKNTLVWSLLWSSHKTDIAKMDIKDEVNRRLQKIFGIIFMLPEFQLM